MAIGIFCIYAVRVFHKRARPIVMTMRPDVKRRLVRHHQSPRPSSSGLCVAATCRNSTK
jgi:hypothetical protein